MSAICVFTPVVVELAWPVLASAVASALASAGYQVVQSKGKASTSSAAKVAEPLADRVELEVPQGRDFAEGLGEEEALTLQKDGVELTFRKAVDGRLKVCVRAPGLSEAELSALGQKAVGAFLQSYVRQKVSTELKKRGYSLDEETLADGTVRLKAKRWG